MPLALQVKLQACPFRHGSKSFPQGGAVALPAVGLGDQTTEQDLRAPPRREDLLYTVQAYPNASTYSNAIHSSLKLSRA